MFDPDPIHVVVKRVPCKHSSTNFQLCPPAAVGAEWGGGARPRRWGAHRRRVAAAPSGVRDMGGAAKQPVPPVPIGSTHPDDDDAPAAVERSSMRDRRRAPVPIVGNGLHWNTPWANSRI